MPSGLFLRGQIHRFVPNLINQIMSVPDRKKISMAAANFAEIETRMKALALPAEPGANIPPVLHFVFGLKQREHLPYYSKIAILSAMYHNPQWRVLFHYTHEPFGPHWEALKPRLTLNQVPTLDYVGNAPMRHYAHKADVLRLLALLHIGGAYLDIDTLTQKSFADLQKFQFVMSQQRHLPGQPGGLCNAIMLGAPNSAFAKLWLQAAGRCRSKGKDWLYDFNAVKLPAMLAYENPQALTVLKSQAFFEPLWDTINKVMFDESAAGAEANPQSYAYHLWNNMIHDKLESIDPNFIKTSKSLYAHIARPVAKAAGDI